MSPKTIGLIAHTGKPAVADVLEERIQLAVNPVAAECELVRTAHQVEIHMIDRHAFLPSSPKYLG